MMNDFPIIYLNSNDGSGILAFGEGDVIAHDTGSAMHVFEDFIQKNRGKYSFGYLGYDLKNEMEDLTSENPDNLGFPDLFFCCPKFVVEMKNENFNFLQGKPDSEALDFVSEFLEAEIMGHYPIQDVEFKSRISKEQYLEKIEVLKEHLQQGDIYEINFCQEFYAENAELKDPLGEYFKLNKVTRAPFSSYIHFDDKYILCGSPERFLKRNGTKLTSQPIKGTAKRGATEEEDRILRKQLLEDPKEKAENVMIVDLVRNDLSRVAEKGSVQVEELFGIYSFETVHQMISTVTAEQKKGVKPSDLLKALFPMGSMTGAPKVKAMQLIEEHECFKRGVYSGAIGYVKPNGDFDFNVVIRSLLYNATKKYLSCSVGGAITIKSDPKSEYEECLIKVQSIMNSLNA